MSVMSVPGFPGFGEQRLEGAKIAGAAHHNQVVAALHSGFGGRVEYHYATFLANGHDDDAHLLAQLHFLDGLGHHLASASDAHCSMAISSPTSLVVKSR